jgi:hypothetical protein
MANVLQLPTPIATTVGVEPNLKFMITADSLSAITTAGYLNQVSLEGYPVASTDIIFAYYNFNIPTQTGAFGIFTVTITGANSTITLDEWVNPGNVTTPTVSGNLAYFTNTNGLLADTGLALTNVLRSNAANVLAAGGSLALNKGALTLTTPAGTLNAQAGVLTTAALTTASGSAYTITLTNSFITASSVILCQIQGGTNTTAGISVVATPGAGSATILLQNSGVAAAALNGTVILSFAIF